MTVYICTPCIGNLCTHTSIHSIIAYALGCIFMLKLIPLSFMVIKVGSNFNEFSRTGHIILKSCLNKDHKLHVLVQRLILDAYTAL